MLTSLETNLKETSFEKQILDEFNAPFYECIPLRIVLELKRMEKVRVDSYYSDGYYGFILLSREGERKILISPAFYGSDCDAVKEADYLVSNVRASITLH